MTACDLGASHRHTSPALEAHRGVSRCPLVVLILNLDLGFLGDCASVLTLLCHFAVLLDSKRYSMTPAVTMYKANLRWSLTTTPGHQQARNYPFCIRSSSHSWSDVAFDHWSNRMRNRVLRRPCLMSGRQVCPRITPLVRRDQDRKHIPALPRSIALRHWPIPPLWGSWIFEEFPVRLSSSPFCSACALMLRNLPRILCLLDFFEKGAGITMLR